MSISFIGSDGIYKQGSRVIDSGKSSGRLITIDSYTSSGSYTWTRPNGCSKVLVKVTGGGGGAAGYCESGGAGGYCEKIIDVTSITSVAVTVGGGGGNVGYYAAAGDGGTSSFGSYASATGGYGANRNYSHTGGVGGYGVGGDINLKGGVGTGHTDGAGRGAIGRGGGSYWGEGYGASHSQTGGPIGYPTPGAGGVGGPTDGNYAGIVGCPGIVVVYSYE